MNTLLLKVILVLICYTNLAVAGNEGPGGGDPRARAFITFAKEIANWLNTNEHSDFDINAGLLFAEIDLLERSLDTNKPKINFTSDLVINDCVENAGKLACTYLTQYGRIESIKVAGEGWSKLGQAEKCELTADEIFFPFVKERRYQKAADVCKSLLSNGITSMTEISYQPESHPVVISEAGVAVDGKYIPWQIEITRGHPATHYTRTVTVENNCIILKTVAKGTVLVVSWYNMATTIFCPDSIRVKLKNFDAFTVIPVGISSRERAINVRDFNDVKSSIQHHFNESVF